MSLPQLSVNRPVTVMMVVAAVLIFGTVSLGLLPQELFPQIVFPQLTVVTPYENAAPEEIETLITKPIEEAIGTVSGIKKISSISKEGLSMVIAEFGWGQNINFAALGMREKIDLVKERLPREAEEPIVLPFNPFDKPILILSVTSSKDRQPVIFRELVRKMIKDSLEKVDGVASANISGGMEREIQVEVDQDKLRARDIPILDISKAISNSNINYPAGTIKESFYEYLIRTLGEFSAVRDIEETVINTGADQEGAQGGGQGSAIARNNNLIYLKDVAKVTDGLKERTSYSRYNGKDNISILVQKQAMGNTVRIIDRVKQRIRELKDDLPKDINIAIVYDQSEFIKSSINGVWEAAWQGAVLVFLVLYFFLRNIWSALIVTLTIPISVITTFSLMFFFGISINMMSLGGLAFGVGHLVDYAIVVVENIFRHTQMGEDQKKAAVIGTDEVFIAVTGSVLTNIVVFLPLIFIVGIFGQIIKDFALTLTFSFLAALIASMTFIPLLASRGKSLSIGESEGSAAKSGGKGFSLDKVAKFYENLLEKYIHQKGKYLAYTLLLFLVSVSVFIFLDKELMPKVDQGQFTIKIDMPAGTRLDVTNSISEKIEGFLLSIPDVSSLSVTVGSTKESTTKSVIERLSANQAEIIITLKKKRKIKSSEIVQIVKGKISSMNLGGARTEYVLQENVLSTGGTVQAPVTIEVKGNDLAALERLTRDIQKGLEKVKGVYGIKNNLAEPSPEAKVFIDKDKSSIYNLSVTDIAQTSLIGLKGYISTKFKEKGEEFDVRVRLRKQDRDSFDKLGRLELQSPGGMKVQLSSVANFGKGKGPSEIKRLNQERVVLVYANIYNRPLKDIVSDVTGMLKSLKTPKDYSVKLTGETEDMKSSFESMRNAIIAAFLLVYMIMAALFESLWQPFIIMFTIPLAVIGVGWSLLITRTSVNAYVLMGFVMLCGIVVNNAIVLIDCINLFLSKGMKLEEAVVKASNVRLRPILMTALTTILGLAPMAFLGGEGAELRAPMAITVMGGLLVATFLTLVVIPALYLMFVETAEKIFKRKK